MSPSDASREVSGEYCLENCCTPSKGNLSYSLGQVGSCVYPKQQHRSANHSCLDTPVVPTTFQVQGSSCFQQYMTQQATILGRGGGTKQQVNEAAIQLAL